MSRCSSPDDSNRAANEARRCRFRDEFAVVSAAVEKPSPWEENARGNVAPFLAPVLSDSKSAYVDHSTNCLDWGVFGGQNVDADVRNRRSWTVWTLSITFAKVRVAGSNPVFRSNVSPAEQGVSASARVGPVGWLHIMSMILLCHFEKYRTQATDSERW